LRYLPLFLSSSLEAMLIHDDAVTLFLDIAGTPSTEIELNELFVTEADEFTLVVPYALKADWRV
jgi:hypothetical protein